MEEDDRFLMEEETARAAWGDDEEEDLLFGADSGGDEEEDEEEEDDDSAGSLLTRVDDDHCFDESSWQGFSESETEESSLVGGGGGGASHRRKRRRTTTRQHPQQDDGAGGAGGGNEEVPKEEEEEEAPASSSSSSSSRTVFSQARGQLQLSVLPKSLPCREQERAQLYGLLRSALADNLCCSLYISGVPGTGKTATVLGIVRELQKESADKTIPDFQFVELNGMTIADPQKAYSILLWHLTGQRSSAKTARTKLATMFTGPKKRSQRCILLVDELDLLVTRKQDVLYNLFEWAIAKSSKLIVVAIANTMDLTQKLLPRITSRIGFRHIVFTSYTRDQLKEIVKARLESIDAFDDDAISWCASKIAAVSGDARRALQICRRAADIAELASEKGNNPSGRVSSEHVRAAIEEIHSTPHIRLIQASSFHEKILLCALVQELRATASPQTTFGKVMHRHKYICSSLSRDPLNCSLISSICYRLASWGLLEADPGSSDLLARVSLLVPQDDVIFALQNDPLISELFELIVPFLAA